VPAESARAWPGRTNALKKPAAICERPAFWTQANTIVFIPRLSATHRRASGLEQPLDVAAEHVALRERLHYLAEIARSPDPT
jgi:hypothetical protein